MRGWSGFSLPGSMRLARRVNWLIDVLFPDPAWLLGKVYLSPQLLEDSVYSWLASRQEGHGRRAWIMGRCSHHIREEAERRDESEREIHPTRSCSRWTSSQVYLLTACQLWTHQFHWWMFSSVGQLAFSHMRLRGRNTPHLNLNIDICCSALRCDDTVILGLPLGMNNLVANSQGLASSILFGHFLYWRRQLTPVLPHSKEQTAPSSFSIWGYRDQLLCSEWLKRISEDLSIPRSSCGTGRGWHHNKTPFLPPAEGLVLKSLPVNTIFTGLSPQEASLWH